MAIRFNGEDTGRKGSMSKRLNKHTEIKGFEQFWREDKPWGIQLRIATSLDGVAKTYTIDCKWTNRIRLPDGRVISNVLAKKIKNE